MLTMNMGTSGSSIVAEHLTRNPEIKGSNLLKKSIMH
jgi:hypothetical protein